MTVADRIRIKREELNISQEELAKMIGNKDKSTISKIEKSGDKITMKNIKRIADALNVSSQYLLGWEDELTDIKKKILKLQFDYEEAKTAGNKELLKHIEEEQDYLSVLYTEKYNKMLKLKYDYESIEVNDPETTKALSLYHQYRQLPDNLKAAVDNLLKSVPPET